MVEDDVTGGLEEEDGVRVELMMVSGACLVVVDDTPITSTVITNCFNNPISAVITVQCKIHSGLTLHISLRWGTVALCSETKFTILINLSSYNGRSRIHTAPVTESRGEYVALTEAASDLT